MSRIPDYIDPVEGWRAWSLVPDLDGIALRSVYAHVTWDPARPSVASCRRARRRLIRPWRRDLPGHLAPRFDCSCGIYAAFEAEPILPLLTARLTSTRGEIGRALGRVALWGEVVECTHGWRASHAYPSCLYVWAPALAPAWRADGGDAVLEHLARYGVPVERIDAAGRRDVLEAVTAAH